jgi:hypothetical protein
MYLQILQILANTKNLQIHLWQICDAGAGAWTGALGGGGATGAGTETGAGAAAAAAGAASGGGGFGGGGSVDLNWVYFQLGNFRHWI